MSTRHSIDSIDSKSGHSSLSYTQLTVLGSANAFNHGGRGNSCFWIEDHLGQYCVDFGPTAPLKCQQLGMDFSKLDCIYLTHLHGDHIGGIPGLLIELHFMTQRKEPFTIAGPQGTEKRILELCKATYPGLLPDVLGFELLFYHWEAESTQQIQNRTVKSIPALHDPQACPTSIRIEGSHHLVFSGDTGWNDHLIPLVDQADAFICECSYEHFLFAGHLSLEELIKHQKELKAKQLILTHFGAEARQAALKLVETPPTQSWGWSVAEDGRIYRF